MGLLMSSFSSCGMSRERRRAPYASSAFTTMTKTINITDTMMNMFADS